MSGDYMEWWSAQAFHTDDPLLPDECTYSLPELQALLGSDSCVERSTSIWADGLDSWVTLGEFLDTYVAPAMDVRDPSEEAEEIRFWRSCEYALVESNSSKTLRLAQLQQMIADGSITDENFIEIEGERDTLQAFKNNFNGFADALLMGDPLDQLAGVAEADWAVRAYFLRGNDDEDFCVAELQEMLESEELTEDTVIWTSGMEGWSRVDELLDSNAAFAAALMAQLPRELLYIESSSLEEQHEVSTSTFRALLRAGAADEATEVFFEGLESWQPLSEVKAALGISAVMGSYGASSGLAEESEDATESASTPLDALQKIEQTLIVEGAGTWKQKKRRALMKVLLSTRSRSFMSVVQKSQMSQRMEALKKADTHATHHVSQLKKAKLVIKGLALLPWPASDDSSSAPQLTVKVRCGRQSDSTSSELQTVDGTQVLVDSLEIPLKTIDSDTHVQFLVGGDAGQVGSATFKLLPFSDGVIRAMSLPLLAPQPSGGVVELSLKVHVNGAAEAISAAAGKAKHGGAKYTGAAGGSGTKQWAAIRHKKVPLAATIVTKMSDDGLKNALAEISSTSPMGQLMAKKLALSQMSSEGTVVTAVCDGHEHDGVHQAAAASMIDYEDTLARVRQPFGGSNWMLVSGAASAPRVVGSGLGSIDEMRLQLQANPKQILFGLLRLVFGRGQFRRTKWCYFHWTGPGVSAVFRGKANAESAEMKKVLTPHHIAYEANSLEDVGVHTMIAWINTVIKGNNCDYTVSDFMEALTEEADTHAAMAGDGSRVECGVGSDEDSGSGDDDDDDSDYDDDSEDDYGPRVRTQPLPTQLPANGSMSKLIVDLGYGVTKFGLHDESAIGPTQLENRGHAPGRRDLISRGKLSSMEVDWSGMEALWDRMFDYELELEPIDTIVSCTVSPYGPKLYSETLAEILFEEAQIPSLFLSLPGVLSLYANAKTTGLVIDSGTCTTSVLPVVQGHCIKNACHVMNFGGRDVTEWLAGVAELPVTTYADYEAVSQAKEQLCSIGVAPHHVGAEDRRFSMPDGGTVELSAEAAQEAQIIPEKMFFNPKALTFDCGYEFGIDVLALQSLQKCSVDIRGKLAANCLLTGGNSLLTGMSSTLFTSIKSKGISSGAHHLKLSAKANRATSAWLGGCVLAELSSWEEQLLTADDYEENGPPMVHRLNILSLSDE